MKRGTTIFDAPSGAPLAIARQGSFSTGGRVLGDPATSSLSGDHGFVEYQIPPNPRQASLLMWHSSSTAVFQNRWDGEGGYQSLFLRKGFPVFLWDGPRVGRANWGCEEYTYKPALGSDQRNFLGWRLGAEFPRWFPGVQFPVGDAEAWNQATRARYDEFDTIPNARLESDAAVELVEAIGPTVVISNSAGGFRGLLTVLKSDQVKAVVAYENPQFLFPKGKLPASFDGPFGPFNPFVSIEVSDAEFERLTRIPMQFVWGDNVAASPFWAATLEKCRRFVDLVNAAGGDAEILELPKIGIRGNTHITMADMNNAELADLLVEYLERKDLAGYR